MKIVITGIAGFIGSRLAEYILNIQKDVYIIGIDDLSGGYIENIPKDDRLLFIKGDLSDPEDQKVMEKEFENGIDYIFHIAAIAAECLSSFMRQFNYKNNVVASAFLINMGIKYNIKRFIFTSSMAVYGNQEAPFDEDLIPKPVDPYGIGKYCVEMDLEVAYKEHNMEYCIIRPHNVYGINQNIFDVYRNVLGIWMYQAIIDIPFTIYGTGEQVRAFSHIDDFLPCLYKSAFLEKAKNQIINVGGIKETSLNEVAKLMLKITNTDKFVYLEPRKEVKYAWSTFQKSIDILDYKETFTLEEGLKQMWEWVKTIPIKERKYVTEYELDKGVYSYWKKE